MDHTKLNCINALEWLKSSSFLKNTLKTYAEIAILIMVIENTFSYLATSITIGSLCKKDKEPCYKETKINFTPNISYKYNLFSRESFLVNHLFTSLKNKISANMKKLTYIILSTLLPKKEVIC